MDEINEFIEKYNKPLSIEEVKKVILNAISLFKSISYINHQIY